MAIRGDLLSVDLSNVFQMLAMNRKRGVLYLQNRENVLEKRALLLDADRVALLDIPDGHDLAALLVDQGELSYDDYRDALDKADQFKVTSVSYLAKRGRLSNDQVEGAVARLHEELILEIFLWKNVSFRLDEASWPDEDSRRRFFVLDLMVMEAARRQDEWERVSDQIGGGKHIWSRVGAEADDAAASFSPVERIVFDHVDNVRGSQEITRATGLPRYIVDTALAEMSHRGNIRKLELDDLIEVGDQLMKDGRHADGIRLFKCAVRYDRKSVALHKRLAQAYLRENRVAKSAAHYKFCAIALVQNGLLREALAIYQYLLTILPTDFRSLEQCLSLLAQIDEVLSADDRQTLEQGLRLCKFYFETGKLQDAQKILDHLLAIAPDDVGLAYLQAKILAKSGKINEAIETYMRLAARLQSTGNLEGALNAYKLVVSFDSATKDICLERMAEIRKTLHKRQRKKAAGLAFFITVLVCVGSAVGYLYYHNSAQAEFAHVKDSESNVSTQDGWAALSQRYAGIIDRFPLTTASSAARERQQHAEMRVAHFAKLQRATYDKEREKERLNLDLAKDAMARAKGKLVLGDLTSALAEYESAWQLLVETGQESWGESSDNRIPERIGELRDHLEHERTALSELTACLDDGRRAEAFAIARKNFFASSKDELSPESVRVVSREARPMVKVPLEVRVAPADSMVRVTGGEAVRGAYSPVLNGELPEIDLKISRSGYRSSYARLDWETSPFETLIVLDRVPSERRELGDRIHSAILGDTGLLCLAGNGVVFKCESLSGAPTRYEPESFVTPSSSIVEFADGVVFGTTEGNLVWFGLDPKKQQRWVRRLSIDPLAHMVSWKGELVVAISEGKPRLVRIDATGKTIGEPLEIGAPLVRLVEAGGRLLGVNQNGAILEFDMESGRVSRSLEGSFSTAPRWFSGAFFATDSSGRIMQIDSGLTRATPFDTRYSIKGDLVVHNGRLSGIAVRGCVVSLDNQMQLKTVGSDWAELLKTATGRLTGMSGGRFIVELADKRQLLFDGLDDTLMHALYPESASASEVFQYADRIILVSKDAHGGVEAYRD